MIFQYAHLLKNSLRLVRFHPNSTPSSIHLILEHQDRYFDKDVHYNALAYVPQGSAVEFKDITLQGRTKLVPSNLWYALSALVESHDISGRFWVEYVCVNQRDEAEKARHRRDLEGIYRAADEVLVWMGFKGAEVGDVASPSSELGTLLRSPRDSSAFQHALEHLHLQQAKEVTLFSGKPLLDARQSDPHSAL